ncbi:MAG TPA: CHAT domain-containing tetratricopeptide repeat protein [Kofleriaceae bacterium]|nr:CHAT domain-containing tetratricopeptide repeat protein [Kofleriaceae bacterium]
MARILVIVAVVAAAAGVARADDDVAPLVKQMRAIEVTDPFSAAKLARRIYEARRKLAGDDHVETIRSKIDWATLLVRTGEYAGAIKLDQELVAQADKLHGADSDDARDRLRALIGAYELNGDDADAAFQRLLALTQKRDGATSMRYMHELVGYGQYLGMRQQDAAAQQAYEQAQHLADAAGHPEQGPITELGLLYVKTAQYPRAQAVFDRNVASLASAPALQRLQRLQWIGSIFHIHGRDDLAKPYYDQAHQIGDAEIARVESEQGPAARELAPVLFTTGWMLYETGDYANADRVLTRLVALQEKLHESIVSYAQLASARRALGRPKEALDLFGKAKDQMARLSKTNHSGMNSMMGDIERELGHYKHAEELYLEEQADLDRTRGKGAILGQGLQLGLVAIYVAAHELDKAQRVLAEDLDIAERELATVMGTGTEADHLTYFANQANQLDTAIAFDVQVAPKSAAATRLALTTLLRRKGRPLDAAAANLATIRGKLSPEDRQLLDDLADARGRLAKLAVAGPTGVADYGKQVAELEDRIRELEVALGKKSAQYRVITQTVDVPAVQAKIPRDARLVELVSYQPRDWHAPDVPKPPPLPRRYAAYVLGARGEPVVVDLGPVRAIDDAIATFRKALGSPDDDHVAERARALYDLAFRPIVPALAGAKQVLIAPDGALNLVPFAALHDGKRYLVEDYTFTFLTSGRDLLRLGVHGNPSGGPIIFADPDFDGGDAPVQPAGRRSRSLTGLTWPRLPGTGQEADAIAPALADATVLRGKQATEAAVKAVHAPPVLHLATHGFFLEGSDDNPLLASGLAFAGANKLASGHEDGILTALEASGLDLWGTKLVAMSACETGLGKVSNGDGVYGLRRALVIAGAESLVMSLWQVDDKATRDLMSGYYKRLKAGEGRSAALRAVQLELAHQPRYAHPYFWASFVAAGDSGPL